VYRLTDVTAHRGFAVIPRDGDDWAVPYHPACLPIQIAIRARLSGSIRGCIRAEDRSGWSRSRNQSCQVAGRLRPGDRERFWLSLNLGPADGAAVRRAV
jgi:hypothetical protein